MDFDRMKRFIELVGELTMKDVESEKPALVKAIRRDFEFIKSEFVEGNRPLYTLCVDDAQGVAQEEYKTTLTDDEIASVKKGLEWDWANVGASSWIRRSTIPWMGVATTSPMRRVSSGRIRMDGVMVVTSTHIPRF